MLGDSMQSPLGFLFPRLLRRCCCCTQGATNGSILLAACRRRNEEEEEEEKGSSSCTCFKASHKPTSQGGSERVERNVRVYQHSRSQTSTHTVIHAHQRHTSKVYYCCRQGLHTHTYTHTQIHTHTHTHTHTKLGPPQL